VLVGQMMTRGRQIEGVQAGELALQHLNIVLPVHSAVFLPLNDQRLMLYRGGRFDARNPALQRLHPGHRQHLGLQRIARANEFEKGLIGGVIGKTSSQLLHEPAKQLQPHLREQPLARTHQRRHQHRASQLCGQLTVQQTVDQNRTTGALSQHVPGRRQLPQQRLLQHPVEYFLVAQKAVDTGALATRQAVPGQIEGQHRVVLLQRPLDQMPIQPHMIVIAVQNQQRAAGHRRLPYLRGNAETVHLDAPQVLGRAVVKVDTVITRITARSFIGSTARLKLRQGVGKGRKKSLVHRVSRLVV